MTVDSSLNVCDDAIDPLFTSLRKDLRNLPSRACP
jgi:hypothetical protein